MFGYRDGHKRPAPVEQYTKDYFPLCDIANKIEAIRDPYEAARIAVQLAEKYFKNGQLHPEMSVISTDSYDEGLVGHHKVRELERTVANSLDKPPNFKITCCTPKCSNPAIKRSHVVQRNKILSTIVDEDNKVLQTKIHPDEDVEFVRKIGWKDASTFPGFCENCENIQFSRAEYKNAPINRDTVGKLLWRAMCFTRYRRAVELQKRAKIVSEPNAHNTAQALEQPLIPFSSALIMKTRISAFRSLDRWIGSFEKGRYGLTKRFNFMVLELENAPFVGAGAIPVHYDLDRKMLSSPRKFINSGSYMSFTSLCSGGKQYVVFGYDNSHKSSVHLIEQLSKLDLCLISAFLPQLIIANSDTVYLSPTWWETKADEVDKHIVMHSFLMSFAQMVFPWWGPIKGVNVVNIFRL